MSQHFVPITFITPSIAQLVERWTVVDDLADIHRSLVQIRLEGYFNLDFTNLKYLVNGANCKNRDIYYYTYHYNCDRVNVKSQNYSDNFSDLNGFPFCAVT